MATSMDLDEPEERGKGTDYPRGDPDGDLFDAAADAFDEAASLIRSTLAAPADAVGKVVAEVLALPSSVVPSTIETPGDYLGEIGCIGVRIRGMLTTRDMLVRIARVAIAGILACDAAKGGAK